MWSGYSRDVESLSSTSRRAFDSSSGVHVPQERKCHKDLLPLKDEARVPQQPGPSGCNTACDRVGPDQVPRERRGIIFKKLPRLIGQIPHERLRARSDAFHLRFGDATAGDLAPLQVGQFRSG